MTTAPPPLRVLSRSDLADLPIGPVEVLDAVRAACLAHAAGDARNPAKLAMPVAGGPSIAYSMLGYDACSRIVGFKTSYTQTRDGKKYYTTVTLYDDETGLPIALLDCARVGALRTPAVSALLAAASVLPGARTALLIGTGTQGRQAFPFLLQTVPGLDRLLLHGTHPEGIAAVHRVLAEHHPDRRIERVTDLDAALADADVVLAASGPATTVRVHTDALRPGAVLVDVGYGVAVSALREADYATATSAAQLAVTGTYLAGPDGTLRTVDAELPQLLAGVVRGRATPADRVFAYNSGMVITDIAVARILAERAFAAGRGREVTLWS